MTPFETQELTANKIGRANRCPRFSARHRAAIREGVVRFTVLIGGGRCLCRSLCLLQIDRGSIGRPPAQRSHLQPSAGVSPAPARPYAGRGAGAGLPARPVAEAVAQAAARGCSWAFSTIRIVYLVQHLIIAACSERATGRSAASAFGQGARADKPPVAPDELSSG